MNIISELKKSIIISIWFMFLTFPLLVIKVNPLNDTILWRWHLLFYIGWFSFFISFVWRHFRYNNLDPADKQTLLTKLKVPFFSLTSVLPVILYLINELLKTGKLTLFIETFKDLVIYVLMKTGILTSYIETIREVNLELAILICASILSYVAVFLIVLLSGKVFRLVFFIFSFIVHKLFQKNYDSRPFKNPGALKSVDINSFLTNDEYHKNSLIVIMLILFFAYPWIVGSPYQVNIMTNALIWVVLGLGLNIVVGLAGLLDLGYVAFYAVGAYTYALLNTHFGFGFWVTLPLCGAIAAAFGLILGFPVLRLRGDYLAIVTLGFGEIIRLILENWDAVFKGPSGISNISKPGYLGIKALGEFPTYLTSNYYIVLFLVLVTIFFVNRLKDSRLGRAWLALREDEIACQAMGINKMRTKLSAFALGATWAGLIGATFAANTMYINPKSFTFWESALILSVVVLGGMGSIPGVLVGAFLMKLLPEYFRTLGEYRMLIFGASMVIMMVFRPQGLISDVRKKYTFSKEDLS